MTKLKPLTILNKGDVVEYQALIEEKIGSWLSKLNCYDNNNDRKSNINGVKVEKERAYFVPDEDYELIVRKKRVKK